MIAVKVILYVIAAVLTIYNIISFVLEARCWMTAYAPVPTKQKLWAIAKMILLELVSIGLIELTNYL